MREVLLSWRFARIVEDGDDVVVDFRGGEGNMDRLSFGEGVLGCSGRALAGEMANAKGIVSEELEIGEENWGANGDPRPGRGLGDGDWKLG